MKVEAKFRGYQSNCFTSEEHGRGAQIERGSQKRKQETGDPVKGGVQQRNYSYFQNNIWLLTVLTL